MLAVNEIYGPVKQGEGKSAGRDVLFIRLSGCNLHCDYCDTPYTWNWEGTKFKHPTKYKPKSEVHMMTVNQIMDKLFQLSIEVKAVVISGGEPLLQQKNLFELLRALKSYNYWIEIETNGTIPITFVTLNLINQINCSPKLGNSGNEYKKRRVRKASESITNSEKATFKFVISNKKDMIEVLRMVKAFRMKEVYLMPEGKTRNEQLAKQDEIKALCQKYNFNFSPRLHILEFDACRGV